MGLDVVGELVGLAVGANVVGLAVGCGCGCCGRISWTCSRTGSGGTCSES